MPTFIDLFAGCGGFSVGLHAAGWTSLAKVEIDTWACDSLRFNFPGMHVVESDIRAIPDEAILELGPVDLIIGGPPCQGFSVAGGTQFGIDDPRNELFRWFLHWVQLLQPKAAIIENVPNMLSRQTGGATVVDAISSILSPWGYSVGTKILNSADFGVPQARRRAFIVMLRSGRFFEFPVPTHRTAASQNNLFTVLKPYVTVGEAISDLPVISAGEGADEAAPYAGSAVNEYQKECRKESDSVTNHIAMKHTARLIERFKTIAPGQSLKDVSSAHGQIANITGEVVQKPFKYNNYRLDPAKPSLAIPASFQSLFLHPNLDRNLTAREAARLMGFPDSFVFQGKRTTMSWEKNLSQYNQIGNAVCPPVALALGRSLLAHIEDAPNEHSSEVGLVVSLGRHRLRPLLPIPHFRGPLPSAILRELDALAQELGQPEESFRFKGFDIPSAALPLGLILADTQCCPICSPDCEPAGRHDGTMCFLISKDGTDSLLENEQDHGLDYHLRTILNLNNQVGHFVGERLAELGMVELISVQNPRTGRKVRGMRVVKRDVFSAAAAHRVLMAIESCIQRNEDQLAISR